MSNPVKRNRIAFMVGIAAGAGLGFWLNSDKGRKVRKDTAEQAQKLGSEVQNQAQKLGTEVQARAEQGVKQVNEKLEQVKTVANDTAKTANERLQIARDSFLSGVEKAKEALSVNGVDKA